MALGKDILIAGLLLILIVLGLTLLAQLPAFMAIYNELIIMVIALFAVLGIFIIIRR